MSSPSSTLSLADVQEIIVRHWGFRTLRPLQDRAMRAVLDGRDSLVVPADIGGVGCHMGDLGPFSKTWFRAANPLVCRRPGRPKPRAHP